MAFAGYQVLQVMPAAPDWRALFADESMKFSTASQLSTSPDASRPTTDRIPSGRSTSAQAPVQEPA